MTADQQSAEHRVPGESLSGRLSARGGVARSVGPSDAFYARFGLRSPWSPEGPVGGFGRDMDLVYLSSAAFFDSMSRLVDRREQRVNRLFGSRSLRKRRDISALRRAGVGPRSFTGWHGLDLLGESDMVVPVEPLAEAVEDAEAVSAGPSRPRGPSMRPVASPWLSFESKPARVFGGTHRSTSQGPSLTKAPTADAGPTLASASAQRADSVRASQARVVPGFSPALRAPSAPVRRRRALDKLADRVGAIGVQPTQTATRPAVSLSARDAGGTLRATDARESGLSSVRSARRRASAAARQALGPSARIHKALVENSLPDAAASPLAMAASRATSSGQTTRGAQRTLFGSPSLAMVARPAITETAETSATPVSRSPVQSSFVPARVVRQAPSVTQASRSGDEHAGLAPSARASRRAMQVARPAPVGGVEGWGAGLASGIDASRTGVARAPRERVDGERAGGRIAFTARALDRGRVLRAASVMPQAVRLSSLGEDAPASDRAALRAAGRARSGEQSERSIVPRVANTRRADSAARASDAGWLDSGFQRADAPAFRRLAAARSSQGLFAPASVMVSPDVAAAQDGEVTSGTSRAPTARAGAPTLSGWKRNELPAPTARVIRGEKSPASAAGPDWVSESRASAASRAAGRASSVPLVGEMAQRTLRVAETESSAGARRSRPNPAAHASVRQVVETLRMSAVEATRAGVQRRGMLESRGADGGTWLVGGDAARRAVAQARRRQATAGAGPESGAARGDVRASQLWAPELTTPQPARAADTEPGVQGADAAPSRDTRRGAAQADVSDAPSVASRPLDWLDARRDVGVRRQRSSAGEAMTMGVGIAPMAGQRGGASAERNAMTDAGMVRVGRTLARTTDGRFVPRTRRPLPMASNFVVPSPAAGAGQVGTDVQSAPVVSGWARPQGTLGDTLAAVEDRQDDAHLPVWARRASGTPLVRGADGGLVTALARASSPEDVVRVILEKADASGTVASTLPQPALQVIEKIKTVAREEVADAVRAEVQSRTASARKAGRRAEAPRSSARVIQGFTGLRRGGGAARRGGVGDDQVMKLAKKLQALINLAEGSGDVSAARRQVRMAEDSAAARGEGQSSPSSAEGGQEASVDIAALTRAVVDAATHELDLRRERRQEDSDERGFWW